MIFLQAMNSLFIEKKNISLKMVKIVFTEISLDSALKIISSLWIFIYFLIVLKSIQKIKILKVRIVLLTCLVILL